MFDKFRAVNFGRTYSSSRGSNWEFTANGKIVLTAILISGVIGIDIQHNLSFQIFSILTALIIVAIIASPKEKNQFNIKRSIPSLATVDTEFQYQILIENKTVTDFYKIQIIDKLKSSSPTVQEFVHFHDPLGFTENWFDRIVGFPRWVRLVNIKMGAKPKKKIIDTIPSKSRLRIELKITPLRRGYIRFDNFMIGIPDTLGLLYKFQKNPDPNKLLIFPKTYPIPSTIYKSKSDGSSGEIPLSRSIPNSKEFQGLRDYRAGDSIKDIHWRSWAHKGYPVVKTFEQEYIVKQALVLDTYAQDISSNCFEEAVSVAASFAQQTENKESLLELMFVQGGQYHLTTGHHSNGINTLLEVLACVEPEYDASFSVLKALVLKNSEIIHSVVCVFLRWNQERELFAITLQNLGISVLILVIEKQIVNLPRISEELNTTPIFLKVDQIEEGLLKINADHPPRI